MKLRKTTKSSFITVFMVVAAFIIVTVMKETGNLSNSIQGILVNICVYVMMALSLNLTVGVLGELSLGHAGFMSIGAFAGAAAARSLSDAITSDILRFAVAVLVGAAFAALMGFLIGIPVLRLRGDYLAIVTLAFGQIIKNLLECVYLGIDSAGLHFSFGDGASMKLSEGGKELIKGTLGVRNTERLSSFTIGFVLILITLAIIFTFIDSKSGRAVMAIRDNRIAAESVGIPITKYKMMAFVLSAAIAGMAGVLYGLNTFQFQANAFDYNQSINILLFVVLGGIGSMRGSIISATFLTLLPELLRGMKDYRMLVYAVVLILVMLITNNKTIRGLVDNCVGRVKNFFSRSTAEDEDGDRKEDGAHE